MKLNKKKVVAISLAVSLIALLSMGTLAWFNASDEVTNKFQVATSDEGAPDFAIDVKENKTDDAGKNFVDEDGDGQYDLTDTGNVYTYVVPDDQIKKNPTIQNTGDYDQWVRVNISISRAFADQVAEEQGVAYTALDFTKLFTGFNSAAFEATREVVTPYADYYTYSYYVAAPLAPNGVIQVFDGIHIPGTFEQADMTYGSFQVIVKAEAVQADNTGDSASAAFTYVKWEAGTAYDQ